MAIVIGKYSSEYAEFVNAVSTTQGSHYNIQTDDDVSHEVDAKTFAETNLGDDIEVTTVVTVTNKAISQVAEPVTLGSGATSVA